MANVKAGLGGVVLVGLIGLIGSIFSSSAPVIQMTPSPSMTVTQAVTASPSPTPATPAARPLHVSPTTPPHAVVVIPTIIPVHVTATPLLTATSYLSNNNYYTNVDGDSVHLPAYSNTVPVGASAQCQDGTYSFSEHHSGTCSHHGGVASWL